MSVVLHGIPIGGGIAIGKAHLLRQGMDDVPQYSVPPEKIADEIARFDEALRKSQAQLDALRRNIPDNSVNELSAFIYLHAMLLSDATLSRTPADLIREKGVNAEWALKLQVDRLSEQFDQIEDEYLRERKQDMTQAVERVFKNLKGMSNDMPQGELLEDTILVATDLSPADTVYLKDNQIAAFVTDQGGPSSHTAILGRGIDIPSVIALRRGRELIKEDEWIIVDGEDGVVVLAPTEDIISEYRERALEHMQAKRKLRRLKTASAETIDGVGVEILANIESVDDAAQAVKNGAAGVGLFRSEFLFLNRDEMPDEEEQYAQYAKVIKKMGGKPVVIRTVDLSADKNPRWFSHGSSSPNPALGMTGIRLCLAEPAMFRSQMKAILRAAVFGPTRMMWPMISSLTEIRQCMAHLETAKDQLRAERKEFDEEVGFGIMIETPAAALSIASMLKMVDFVSIGTNDLIQYTLAVDRGNDQVSHMYQPTHPVVLKLIQHVIKAANKIGKPVSVCGEMAGDPNLTRVLMAIGLRRFSMHPSRILAVKSRVISTDLSQIENAIQRLVRLNDDPEKSLEMTEKFNAMNFEPNPDLDDSNQP